MLRGGLILALLAAFAFPAGAVAIPSHSTSLTRDTTLEELVLREVNALRARQGMHSLSPSSTLSRAAVFHTRSMASAGYFSHTSNDGTPFSKRLTRFYAARSGVWTVGENLAMFGGAAPTAKAIVEAWMASPGHRANLLRPQFREAGIAVFHHPAASGVFGGLPTWVITLDVGRR
jgi:uncharacterized protein YkwD